MSIRILLIEDNPDHILLTKRILQKVNQDYHLDSESEARVGLRMIIEDNYDLVLCDYHLPGLSALEILREIRKRGKDLPFVVITALGNEKAAVDLMKEGAYDYIVKDVFYDHILPMVIKKSIERYRDVTERKKAEEEIKRQKEFIENVINALNFPFYVINLDYTIALANEVARNRGIVEGGYCYRLTHNLQKPCEDEHACPLREVLRTEKSVQMEHIHYDKEGNKTVREIHGIPIFSMDGQIVQMIEFTIDITERKKAEEALQNAYHQLKETQEQLIQSGKMVAMGQLSAGISHELNQPLTGIKGFTQAILMDLDESSPIRQDLKKIEQQAERMDKIIKNIRLFAQKARFKLEPIDINQPIEDSFMLLNQQLKLHNIKVEKHLKPDLPKIKGDANQLQQVFLNLITNARDAIDALNKNSGGAINVTTDLDKDRQNIKVVFSDTGCGIKKEELNNIFNPFYTTKSPGGGIGLGLSICYRIIQDHKATIEVNSKRGKGTSFILIFPVIKNRAEKEIRYLKPRSSKVVVNEKMK
jgi:signal transduction histidine kinase